MFKNGDNILIAVSGGADSTALCRALAALREKMSLRLFAVHLNHNLRGEESDCDEQFVRDLCAEYDISLTVYSEDIAKGAAECSKGIEEYARFRRYELFSSLAKELDAKLATAHNLNDVAETLIFNIARGCSLNGIGSVSAVRGNIIRPLINISREEIELYLSEIGQNYVTDSTNFSDDYTRNNIRHNILPKMQGLNPSFLTAVERLTNSARSALDYIGSEAAKLINEKADSAALCGIHEAVLAQYVCLRCKNELNLSPSYPQIQTAVSVIKSRAGAASLGGGNSLYIDGGKVLLGKAAHENQPPFCIKFDINGVKTPYNEYEFEICGIKEYNTKRKINNLLLKNAVDYDKINKDAVVRSKNVGDKISLANRRCGKTLKKLFCEMKIPQVLRNRLAILSNDKNEIIWVENVGAAADFAVTENTRNVLCIKYKNGSDLL